MPYAPQKRLLMRDIADPQRAPMQLQPFADTRNDRKTRVRRAIAVASAVAIAATLAQAVACSNNDDNAEASVERRPLFSSCALRVAGC